MSRANGIRPKTSIDGLCLDWFPDSQGYCLDAPSFISAGSSLGATKATPSDTRRYLRGAENVGFETNLLIWEA